MKLDFGMQCIRPSYTKSMHSNSMQALQSTYKIKEDVKNEDLLSIVADKYCRFILEAIMDVPKSTIEIASEKKILSVPYTEESRPFMTTNWLRRLARLQMKESDSSCTKAGSKASKVNLKAAR